MLLFRSVLVGSPVALAIFASVVPPVMAAPWWPMHYVLAELSPDLPSASAAVPAVRASPSAASPGITGAAGPAAAGSIGLDNAVRQASGAGAVGGAGARSILVGCTTLALYLAL